MNRDALAYMTAYVLVAGLLLVAAVVAVGC